MKNFKHVKTITHQGKSHSVVAGKIMFVVEDRMPQKVGQLAKNIIHDLFEWTELHPTTATPLVEYRETKTILPVIVSLVEDVENNIFFHQPTKSLEIMFKPERSSGYSGYCCNSGLWIYAKDYRYPVIADTCELSPELIQEILTGKLKEGNEVFVKVEPDRAEGTMHYAMGSFNWQLAKTNPMSSVDSYITHFPYLPDMIPSSQYKEACRLAYYKFCPYDNKEQSFEYWFDMQLSGLLKEKEK